MPWSVRWNETRCEEMVDDKGYHSGAAVERVKSYRVRSYIPERQQKGRRHWEGKAAQQRAVYANRRRVQGNYGKSLLRRRGELVERSFAHCYDTGGMRRTHLRKHHLRCRSKRVVGILQGSVEIRVEPDVNGFSVGGQSIHCEACHGLVARVVQIV